MIMKKTILTIVMFLAVATSAVCQEKSDDEFRQYTSWIALFGPSSQYYIGDASASSNAPDKIMPSIGLDAGMLLAYHISQEWALTLSTVANMERMTITKDDFSTGLTTLGADLSVMISRTLTVGNKPLQLGAGPFSHFILASLVGDPDHFSNPYTGVAGIDPRSDKPYFCMNKTLAGIELNAMIGLSERWFLMADFKYGVTNLMNSGDNAPTKSGNPVRTSIHPVKLTVAIGLNL